jgi:protein-tyrosine phosphatase
VLSDETRGPWKTRPVVLGDEPVRIGGTVLVVCTANVCRSPLAARLLADALPDAAVSSAGVQAVVGAPMCTVSAAELPHGAADTHIARQLTADVVRSSDLVLTMEREHRSAVVRLAPGSQSSVLTLREALALSRGLVDRGAPLPEDLASLAAALHGMRGLVPMQAPEPPKRRWWGRPVLPEDPLTVVDGHRRPGDAHRAAAAQVARTTEELLDALRALQVRAAAPSADSA